MNGNNTGTFEQFTTMKADIMQSVNQGFAGVDKGFDSLKDSIKSLASAIDNNTAANSKRFNELFDYDKDRRGEIAKLETSIVQAKAYAFEIVVAAKAEIQATIDGAIASVRADNSVQQTDIDALKTTAQVVEKLSNNSWMKWGLIITSVIGIGAVIVAVVK